jgi:hypothetical protein
MKLEALQRMVASDAQGRGAAVLCRVPFWESALQLFVKASRIFIITGFYIKSAEAPETDGPPGAVALGRALTRAGKSVAMITDCRNYACLEACSRRVNGPEALCLDDYEKVPTGSDLLVFIERPGHAVDGRYYNMRGVDISDVVAPLDRAADAALSCGVPVLGVGDGGNEAGMGLLYDVLAENLPNFAPFLSRVSASVCLPVDVSNWGAYALTAVLSVFYREWLGLEDGEEGAMLNAMLEAGAVDGVTGRQGLSVDGVPLPSLEKTNLSIRNWYSGSFEI